MGGGIGFTDGGCNRRRPAVTRRRRLAGSGYPPAGALPGPERTRGRPVVGVGVEDGPAPSAAPSPQALGVYALTEICRVGTSLWLTWWSGGRWGFPVLLWMGIYALWGLGQTLFSLVNSVFLAHRGVHAARALHENMLSRIMKAPVAFFDATPRGLWGCAGRVGPYPVLRGCGR